MKNFIFPDFDTDFYFCNKCMKNTFHNNLILFIFVSHNSLEDKIEYSIQILDNLSKKYLFEHKKNKISDESLKEIIPNDKFFCICFNFSICKICGHNDNWTYNSKNEKYIISEYDFTNYEIEEPDENIPRDLVEIYNDARKNSLTTPRTSTILSRYLLEEIFNRAFKNINKGTIDGYLKEEIVREKLGELWDTADAIRVLGNKAIHAPKKDEIIDMNHLYENISKIFSGINAIAKKLNMKEIELSNDLKNIENNVVKKKTN